MTRINGGKGAVNPVRQKLRKPQAFVRHIQFGSDVHIRPAKHCADQAMSSPQTTYHHSRELLSGGDFGVEAENRIFKRLPGSPTIVKIRRKEVASQNQQQFRYLLPGRGL